MEMAPAQSKSPSGHIAPPAGLAPVFRPSKGDVPWGGKAALRISNSSSSDVRGIALPTGLTSEITPPPQITKTQVISFDRNGYRQQLIYGGRVGAILRFQYRSVFGDGSQPPSNQDFEWNLLDGPVVSYRGAKIEILESTNARLSYRVISSFEESTSQP